MKEDEDASQKKRKENNFQPSHHIRKLIGF